VFLSKVSRVSSKQAMFAKPPKVLCLHVARSTYLPTGEIHKNTCQIKFPQLLDLAPYCTNGTLNTQPNLPISSTSPSTGSSSVKYRLMSSIVHFGSHNFGHFIAYKRRLVAESCSCQTCCNDSTSLKHHDSDWFKISDERVDSCDVVEVLEANPYMLLYELIDDANQDQDTLDSAEAIDMQAITKLSTVVIDQEIEEDEDQDWITPNLPAAPPSSPLLLPLQLSSSITSSCSLITQPHQRRSSRNSKKDLWTKATPVAIY
jgi:ubiquitin carboxyl-terminal hydrolase 1